VKIESLSDKGRKLAFTIVSEGNDLENGMLGILTPLGQALIDAQEGDDVEYQVGVEIGEVRVLEVAQPNE
jgi:transcription elongation GreA/GreB family factor